MSDREQQPENAPETLEHDLLDQILSGYADRQNSPADLAEDAEDDGVWASIQSRLEADQAAREDRSVPEFDEGLLCAYADGEFSTDDPEIMELESWLHAAPEAHRLIAAFSTVSQTVRGYSYRMEAVCDIDVTDAVMSRFRQEQDGKVVSLTRFKKPWVAIPAVAAVLLVAFIAGNPMNRTLEQEMAGSGIASPASNMADASTVMTEQQAMPEALIAQAPAEMKLRKDLDSVAVLETGMKVSEAEADLMEGNELRQKEEAESIGSLAKARRFSDDRVALDEDAGRSRNNSGIGGFAAGTGSTEIFRPDTGMRMASAANAPRRDSYYSQESAPRKQAAKPAPSAPAARSERHLANSEPGLGVNGLEISSIPTAEEYVMNYCHDELPSETDAFGFMYSCVEDVSR